MARIKFRDVIGKKRQRGKRTEPHEQAAEHEPITGEESFFDELMLGMLITGCTSAFISFLMLRFDLFSDFAAFIYFSILLLPPFGVALYIYFKDSSDTPRTFPYFLGSILGNILGVLTGGFVGYLFIFAN